MSVQISTRRIYNWLKQCNAWLDKASLKLAPPGQGDMSTPMDMARPTILVGMWTVVIVFGVFGLWASLAPLDSAAIAIGKIVVDGNRKTIQHLEGGVVDEILVKEGDIVKQGQVLVRLNRTAAKARFDLQQGQYNLYKATEARLVAERDGKDTIQFPSKLLDKATTPEIAEILETQKRLFTTRKSYLEGQIGILEQRREQFKKEIEGLNAQVTSADEQMRLLQEEVDAVKKLLEKGNAVKPRLLALERTLADLGGQKGKNEADIARAHQEIIESELAITNQKSEFQDKVNNELKDTQAKLSDLEEQIRAAADIMTRIEITSPIDGKVNGLAVHTVGGVVSPGKDIMDIVPQNDKLIVEAMVSPSDIDVVHTGLEARVRLTAFRSRSVPPVMGKVINVSGDRFTDERNGSSYYLARVEIDPDDLQKHEEIKLYPGMPADVLIITGERTLMKYLMSPIIDSFRHSFREQ